MFMIGRITPSSGESSRWWRCDLDYQFFSGQTVFTGVGAGYRCRPPVKTILAGDQDLFSRSLAILHSATHHRLTSAKLIRSVFRIEHHQLIVQHRIGIEPSAQRGRDGFRARFLDAARSHAAVFALDNDSHIFRFGDFL